MNFSMAEPITIKRPPLLTHFNNSGGGDDLMSMDAPVSFFICAVGLISVFKNP